jgi:hypothetical protein
LNSLLVEMPVMEEILQLHNSAFPRLYPNHHKASLHSNTSKHLCIKKAFSISLSFAATMHFTGLSIVASLLLATQVSSRSLPPSKVIEKRAAPPTATAYPRGGLNVAATNNGPILALANGVFVNFQASDSNFVVYDNINVPVWNAGANPPHSCAAPNTCELVFQTDGNLVRYVNGVATWNSQTAGTGYLLEFNDIAPYIVIYNSALKPVFNTPIPVNGGKPPVPTPPPGTPVSCEELGDCTCADDPSYCDEDPDPEE